jgi:hypothetical protein
MYVMLKSMSASVLALSMNNWVGNDAECVVLLLRMLLKKWMAKGCPIMILGLWILVYCSPAGVHKSAQALEAVAPCDLIHVYHEFKSQKT